MAEKGYPQIATFYNPVNIMTFFEEPVALHKTALSDLQGAWHNLRSSVVEAHPFPGSARLIFQIDEGMSWESVRNLEHMKKIILVVRNIAQQNNAPDEVLEGVEMVSISLEEVFEAISKGEIC